MNAKVLVVFGIIVSMTLAVVWASPSSTEATTFRPEQGNITFSDESVDANPDITTNFNVLETAPASANFTSAFGGAVTFEDKDVLHAADAGIPDGAYVGTLTTVAQLGTLNGSCSSPGVVINFNFVDATTSDATIISPSGPPSNLLANLAEDDGDLNNDQQTALDGAAAQNDTSITVLNSSPFSQGDTIFIGGPGTTIPESVTLAVDPPNATEITVPALAGPHDDGEVVAVPDVTAFAFNGIPDGADAYPSFVRDSLDPDGPSGASPIAPRARYFGTAFVASSLIVILQFVVLDTGALTVMPNMDWAVEDWGYPAATFLNNPLAPPSNSAITDFCNFTSQTVLEGNAQDNACTPVAGSQSGCAQSGAGFTLRFGIDGGCPAGGGSTNECDPDGVDGPNFPRVTNPGSSQTVTWRQWAVSQRDWDQGASPPADGDGIENGLDPCPIHGSGLGSVDSWDPRASTTPAEDTDTVPDGIPNTSSVGNLKSCDPTSTSTTFDEDGDNWDNRLDNCPVLANGNFNSALDTGGASDGDSFVIVAAASGAINPVGFVVGDIISVTEGTNSDVGLVLTGVSGTTLTFSGQTLNNAYTTAAIALQTTFAPNTGQFDLDVPVGTAVADAGPRSDGIGAPCDPHPNAINGHYHATMIAKHVCIGTPTDDCSDAIDDDGDGVFNDSDNCIGGANAAPAGFAQSQRDLNIDGFSDIGDIVLAAGKFGTQGGNPVAVAGYEGRLDLNYDRFVDITDIVLLAGVFTEPC